MTAQLNSIFNLIANVSIFIGGFLFYYHHISCNLKPWLFHSLRFFTGLLVVGALARVLFDLNIIYTGQVRYFDILEASIALSRNIGLGVILIYLSVKK